jgi:hypothetical protein
MKKEWYLCKIRHTYYDNILKGQKIIQFVYSQLILNSYRNGTFLSVAGKTGCLHAEEWNLTPSSHLKQK